MPCRLDHTAANSQRSTLMALLPKVACHTLHLASFGSSLVAICSATIASGPAFPVKTMAASHSVVSIRASEEIRFCYLHHLGPEECLEYGLNHKSYCVQNSAFNRTLYVSVGNGKQKTNPVMIQV